MRRATRLFEPFGNEEILKEFLLFLQVLMNPKPFIRKVEDEKSHKALRTFRK